jgi:prepilin-type N-terminal cleavage/methylation domain-containing protein
MDNKNRTHIKEIAAFTLIEILVVIIIISILAAFSVPNFSKSVKRARARDAINNLTAIHAAQLIYRSLNSSFNRCNNVAAINSLNGPNSLNIVENGATYTCNDGGGAPTVCTAVSGDFTVTATLANPVSLGVNPVCVSTPVAAKNCP